MILGNGGTLWRMADASPPDRDGWQHMPVDPRVVAARVAGLSHGFLVFDDTGSEWTRTGETFTLRLFPNRFVYSREQNRASAPYFTIELGPDDHQPPVAPERPAGRNRDGLLPAGEAIVSWITPRDNGPAGTLGFFVTLDGRPLPRELIPLAARAGERVEMHLRDLKLAAGATLQARRAGGRRRRQSRAGRDGRMSRSRAASRPPCPGPDRHPASRPANAATDARRESPAWRSRSSMSSTRSTRSPAS